MSQQYPECQEEADYYAQAQAEAEMAAQAEADAAAAAQAEAEANEPIEKLIFDMVYQWGRVGVKTDYTAPVYQDLIKQLISSSKIK
jgi:hypothetical protein